MDHRPDGEQVREGILPAESDQTRAQLERLLESKQFRSSRRCQLLLRYITEHTLEGDTLGLKERTLGVEVFGRPAQYDTNQDPVVRATAAEIRKKLAQYYQGVEHEEELRIELLPGSYVPEFHPAPHFVAPPAPAPVPPPPRRNRWPFIIAAALVVSLIATGAVYLLPHRSSSVVEDFWAPMLDATGGTLFCMGQPHAYNFTTDSAARVESLVQNARGASFASSKETVPVKDLLPLWDRYIAIGDTLSLLRMTALFEKRDRPYRIRGAASTASDDLRESPAVLVGAFDNVWTLRVANQLRFWFYTEPGKYAIRDRQHPERDDWKLVNAWPYWDISYDYAVVARFLDRNTDRMIMIAAGIAEFGTTASGEFMTSSKYLDELTPKLPKDWKNKNLEVVLGVPVVHGAAGHPQILAVHVWDR